MQTWYSGGNDALIGASVMLVIGAFASLCFIGTSPPPSHNRASSVNPTLHFEHQAGRFSSSNDGYGQPTFLFYLSLYCFPIPIHGISTLITNTFHVCGSSCCFPRKNLNHSQYQCLLDPSAEVAAAVEGSKPKVIDAPLPPPPAPSAPSYQAPNWAPSAPPLYSSD